MSRSVCPASRCCNNGVDARFTGVLRFAGDVLGIFDCGMDVHRRNQLEIVGSEGTIASRSRGRRRSAPASRSPAKVSPSRSPPRRSTLTAASSTRWAGRSRRRPTPLGRANAVGQARTIEALYRAADTGTSVSL